ncbi:hypothetical protein D9611_002813 [Ephemerocybe angulata]|uniref:DUF4470 domain-containing protein n=1 Tax=Ephemerocybe angulata TaxID=980116 RepID=A0A8H5C0Y3_9AGAR|nr:hypothetical protein D9611_002813 [Tulosesus angulatus]
MAHPTLWLPKSFFYPIGNTPATSLTEYIPPDVDAKVLVLGCGDPRNTLYTIFSDSKLPFKRALDFTFCDTEPAVLARNILIYTLLYDRADKKTIKKVWKIYLDVFIDKESFDLIVAQCTKLVDLSSSMERWGSHPYGTFVKFCTEDTMVTLRQYWERYLFKDRDAAAAKPAVLKDLKDVYDKKMANSLVMTSGRSAGVMLLEMGTLGTDHFKHYWDEGVTDVEPGEIKRATHVNTTLLYSSSGDTLNIHYGTDPILCFHLAPALAPTEGHPSTPVNNMQEMIVVLKAQFAAWAHAFHNRLNSHSNIQLRFFAGNAMTFCKVLRAVALDGRLETTEYTNTWGNAVINLTPDYQQTSDTRPPVLFSVIETSNLADHIGFLNLLLLTAPLLRRDPSSILFTHSLTGLMDGQNQHTSALSQIGMDLSLLSLLLGLVPERARATYTSQSIVAEAMTAGMTSTTQFFEHNFWRIASLQTLGLVHAFDCEPADLAKTLFRTYHELFADEGRGGYGKMRQTTDHYTRDSFVCVLSAAKAVYTGNWKDVMKHIMHSIETDSHLPIGLQGYQEFCRGLDQAGVYNIVPDPNRFITEYHGHYFEKWPHVPGVVHVGMAVPHGKIARLLDDSKEVVAVPLLCEVTGPDGQNFFASIQPAFGTIEATGEGPNKTVVIHEDPAGWSGTSDMIVHFSSPAWIFGKWPPSRMKISIFMFGMAATERFISKLGVTLCIHSTSFGDSRTTFILRDRPRLASQTISQDSGGPSATAWSPASNSAQRQLVRLKFEASQPASFAIRCPIEESKARASLAEKATRVALAGTARQEF